MSDDDNNKGKFIRKLIPTPDNSLRSDVIKNDPEIRPDNSLRSVEIKNIVYPKFEIKPDSDLKSTQIEKKKANSED